MGLMTVVRINNEDDSEKNDYGEKFIIITITIIIKIPRYPPKITSLF